MSTNRKETIDCKTLKQAKELAPWACDFVRVEGGYRAFASTYDAQVFKNQK